MEREIKTDVVRQRRESERDADRDQREREMSIKEQLIIRDGELEAYNLCLGFVPCMVAKAVCELGIPQILAAHPHHQPMSALRIAQLLSPPPSRPLPEAAQQLDRMMQCLCAYKVFESHVNTADSEQLNPQASTKYMYSSTPVSECLASLQPFLMLEMSLQMQAPWHHLSQSLLHGFPPFTAAHSMDVWALAASDLSFGHLVNSAMACASHLSLPSFLNHYDGFRDDILSLVDVGGGIGVTASAIAARYVSMKVINFDLPGVIDTAPNHPGVQHISGDMFESVPSADSILLKWVLHDWNDEDCIKILDNCHKVLPKHGKLIIMEAVLDLASAESDVAPFRSIRIALDMVMLAHTNNGYERTKNKWEMLLRASNFTLCRIIDLPVPQCIIEATPL